ncbi:MAG: hypothetical protein JNM56_28735 [Planctomycetia bacterium]|nr:hypothetical protein [Planctomycetia bacterium]
MLTLLRGLLVCGLMMGQVGVGQAADDADQAAKKKDAGAQRGLVKDATPDKDNKDIGTLTIQLAVKKKKGEAPDPADTKKIVVTKDTKIEKVEAPIKGQKDAPAAGVAAKFSDLQTNAQVLVTLKTGTDTAEKIQIIAGAKKAKKDANE